MTPDFDKTEKKRLVKVEIGFDFFTQSSTEYLEQSFVSLNNRFPNLVGWGIIQFLKQMMAQEPSGKIMWTDEKVETYCALMNVQRDVLNEVITYCVKNLRLLRLIDVYRCGPENLWVREKRKVLYFPKLMDHLIDLQIKRKAEEALYYEQYKVKNIHNQETYNQKRARMTKDLKAILVLTEEEKVKYADTVQKFYPGVEFESSWEKFCETIKGKYLEWHGQLAPENKEQTFYIFLNNLS